MSLNSDNNMYLYIIIVVIVFFVFVLPMIDKQNKKEMFEIYESFSDIVKVDANKCSKQCCKFTQWPVPFNTSDPKVDNSEFDKYIPSNLNCNNGSGGGCVCITKDDYQYLSDKGNNA
jgi:hypothetical protein